MKRTVAAWLLKGIERFVQVARRGCVVCAPTRRGGGLLMRAIAMRPRGFCAGRSRHRHRGRGARPLSAADLRAPRDRPQPRRGRGLQEPRRDLRRRAVRSSRRPRRRVQRPRGRARGVRRRGTAQFARHRCHLPARHQGAPRGATLRAPGLRHRAHRTRGSRRSIGHDRRGTGSHPLGRQRRRRRTAGTDADRAPGLLDADDAVGDETVEIVQRSAAASPA